MKPVDVRLEFRVVAEGGSTHLRVRVVEARGIDPAIFRVRGGKYMGICTPTELQSLPVGHVKRLDYDSRVSETIIPLTGSIPNEIMTAAVGTVRAAVQRLCRQLQRDDPEVWSGWVLGGESWHGACPDSR